jgi:hypothetical protein
MKRPPDPGRRANLISCGVIAAVILAVLVVLIAVGAG